VGFFPVITPFRGILFPMILPPFFPAECLIAIFVHFQSPSGTFLATQNQVLKNKMVFLHLPPAPHPLYSLQFPPFFFSFKIWSTGEMRMPSPWLAPPPLPPKIRSLQIFSYFPKEIQPPVRDQTIPYFPIVDVWSSPNFSVGMICFPPLQFSLL